MQKLICPHCNYTLINYSDTHFSLCPSCDHPITLSPVPYEGACDICGEQTTVIDVEVDPFAVLAVCAECSELYNIE